MPNHDWNCISFEEDTDGEVCNCTQTGKRYEFTWRDYCPCCGYLTGHDPICIKIHAEIENQEFCSLSIFEQAEDTAFTDRQIEIDAEETI